MVAQVSHRAVLDVGPGHGKYATLLREYVGGLERMDAVEAWLPYVKAFRLDCLYDEVMVRSIEECPAELLVPYDVVLMVDVLEHLHKDAGQEVIDRIAGRVVICTPRDFFQNPEADEIGPERHRSVWTVEDFEGPRLEVGYVNHVGAVLVRLGPREESS